LEALTLKFETPNWARSPAFGLLDTILEQHPEFIVMIKDDICTGCATSNFGRKDTPSVEQVVRVAPFKELKDITYEKLTFQQEDSNICRLFLKLEIGEEYSSKTWQKFISKVSEETLKKFLVEINKVAIEAGFEDVSKMREDSTVIETNIHYPTNNSLVLLF
jgi:IS5 family transposase